MNSSFSSILRAHLERLAASPARIWCFVFGYILAVGLFVQLILLPYWMPAWHWGSGLFVGLDGPSFHNIALELSRQIRLEGWGVWSIRPSGQFVSAVAAIAYVLIYPAPWSVLPINAAMAATAALGLVAILDGFLKSRKLSLLASLPFVFFPSALLWNAQFHNENYAVPGTILILYGLAQAVSLPAPTRMSALRAFSALAVGAALLGLVREDALDAMLLLSLIGLGGLTVWRGIAWLRGGARFYDSASLLLAAAVLGGTTMLIQAIPPTTTPHAVAPWIDPESDGNVARDEDWQGRAKWFKTSWLPDAVDERLKRLADRRFGAMSNRNRNGSGTDLEIQFSNAGDVLAYQPRAFQIAFFSPFPNAWFGRGNKITGGVARSASAFEMMIAYAALFGLPYFAWQNRRSPALWIILLVCTGMLLLLATATPNLGTLYRFRFPYYMPLVAMGIGGWLMLADVWRARRAVRAEPGSGVPAGAPS